MQETKALISAMTGESRSTRQRGRGVQRPRGRSQLTGCEAGAKWEGVCANHFSCV